MALGNGVFPLLWIVWSSCNLGKAQYGDVPQASGVMSSDPIQWRIRWAEIETACSARQE